MIAAAAFKQKPDSFISKEKFWESFETVLCFQHWITVQRGHLEYHLIAIQNSTWKQTSIQTVGVVMHNKTLYNPHLGNYPAFYRPRKRKNFFWLAFWFASTQKLIKKHNKQLLWVFQFSLNHLNQFYEDNWDQFF